MPDELARMAEAIKAAIPRATVAVVDPLADLCPDCNGDGVTSWMAYGHRETLSDCTFCGGSGWLEPTDPVDDADHAEFVDPVDHTHDAQPGPAALTERLTAVLNLHRSTADHTCEAEPFRLYPCPTARAALGLASA